MPPIGLNESKKYQEERPGGKIIIKYNLFKLKQTICHEIYKIYLKPFSCVKERQFSQQGKQQGTIFRKYNWGLFISVIS